MKKIDFHGKIDRPLLNKRARATQRVKNYEEIIGEFKSCPAFGIRFEAPTFRPFTQSQHIENSIPSPRLELPMTHASLAFIIKN
ncbi:hypothetical protein [Williamwhitmania taraxaci]|uniref:hypothetical protein n=1 Tax=Williamwhitmania taraxaci TaxID=1640674 RepID=UPI000B88443A|nr:hypothetical protein [Williamwhitmania taraxaci]